MVKSILQIPVFILFSTSFLFPNSGKAADLGRLNDQPILFVGVSHLEEVHSKALSDPQSEASLKKAIAPFLENDSYSKEKTILFIEGVQFREPIYYGTLSQEQILDSKFTTHIPQSLLPYAGRVMIADYRTLESEKFYQQIGQVTSCFDYSNLPLDAFELMRVYIAAKANCVPDSFWEPALKILKENQIFELHAQQLAHHYASKGYKVIFVLGSAHVARMVTVHSNDGLDESYDYFIPSHLLNSTFSNARKMVSVEKAAIEHFKNNQSNFPWYDWKHFQFSHSDLPPLLQKESCKIKVDVDSNRISVNVRSILDSKSKIIAINRDCVKNKIPAKFESEQSVIFELLSGEKIPGRILTNDDIQNEKNQEHVPFEYHEVYHEISMNPFYAVIPSNQSFDASVVKNISIH